MTIEQDHPLKGVPNEVLTKQPLINALRKELGMTFNDYYMVLTDFDMKVKVGDSWTIRLDLCPDNVQCAFEHFYIFWIELLTFRLTGTECLLIACLLLTCSLHYGLCLPLCHQQTCDICIMSCLL